MISATSRLAMVNNPYGRKKDDKNEQDNVVQVLRVHHFTTEAVNRFRRGMEIALENRQGIIPVYIDSYGGYVYSLLAMVDLIQKAKDMGCIVPTIIEGKAMSCGAILASVGTEGQRWMAPNATVMIHDASSMSYGKSHELEASTAETKRLNKVIFGLMDKGTGQPDGYFLDLVSGKGHADWYLTTRECKKHFLVNKVGIPTLDVNMQLSFG